MFFQNFSVSSVSNTYPRFEDLLHVYHYNEYTVYEEENLNRTVPEESCLWKNYADGTSIEQKIYKMRYVVKKCGNNHSQVIEKVSICEPDVYECNGSLISVMAALLSDNVEPRYYEMKNDLVTERVIYLKQICVYRDFKWNTHNRSSFMAQANYYVTDRRRRKPYTGPDTLRHELMAVMKNYNEGIMIPTTEVRPTGPRVMKTSTRQIQCNWRPFWPTIKEGLVKLLKEKGYFYFFPTTRTQIEVFRNNKNISREIDREFIALVNNAVDECDSCDQDYCVWSMNYKTITHNVNLMRGGIWNSLYSDQDRREIGCKLAIYIMNNGSGRQYDRKEVPRCVLQKLSEKWPV